MNSSSPDPAVDETTPVLIVGGSLVGLTMSLFLGKHGIRPLVVERHPGTSIHPRVASLTARTMEIFRSVGAEPVIRQVEPRFSTASRVPLAESLVGEEFDNLMEDMSAYFTEASPVDGSLIAQDVLETVLPDLATQFGASLRYRTELVDFWQDPDGVTATVRDLATGTDRRVRAEYLIAADGGRSGIRSRLGIGVHGVGSISHQISVLFEAPGLLDLFHEREAVLCFLTNDLVSGGLTPYPGASIRPDRFRLDFVYDPETESVADYPIDRCVRLVQAAIGIPDYPITIRTVLTWEMAARVADRFCADRVFLVGDAARTQPPTGGLGGNTGIAEAHNLAWKLAAVLNGRAGRGLLATYDLERRQVADYTVDQVLLLSRQRQSKASEGISVSTLTLNMGYRYDSGAGTVPKATSEPLPAFQDPRLWTGQPGTRAPHVVLAAAGRFFSVLELFGSEFILLAGPEGQSWLAAGEQVAQDLDLPLSSHQGGTVGGLAGSDGQFCAAYGITPSGAVIVRPDGFVGWRSMTRADDVRSELTQALTALLFR